MERRSLLLGGLATAGSLAVGAALVEGEVLPGRARLHAVIGIEGPDGTIPDVSPGKVIQGGFDSSYLGRRTRWRVVRPPGHDDGSLPVVVVLHGKGGDEQSAADKLGLDHFLAAAVADGAPPAAVVSVDGGDGYWHPRDDGTDSGSMVVEELLPAMASEGLDVSRVGLLGWSMGGYGAFLLTGTSLVGRVAAVATISAALWVEFEQSAPGAFDDAADFRTHDVFALAERLQDVPLSMACGDLDPFREANVAFMRRVGLDPEAGIQSGGHTAGFFRRVAGVQLEAVLSYL
jgi:pimeloyl-ACP methyl ester carboxylesterase